MPLKLRAVNLDDRPAVYEMLARSDATAEMMGPPDYCDHPVPDWDEFCEDYDEEAFSPDGDFRIFMMEVGGRDIGVIHHWLNGTVAEIDLWIADRRDWGKGHGSSAIGLIAAKLRKSTDAEIMIIRPSGRNNRAIAAYRKAGFQAHDPKRHHLPNWCLTEGFDYEDAVVLVQDLR